MNTDSKCVNGHVEGLVAIVDRDPHDHYQGHPLGGGGLYPEGNDVPAAHLALATERAQEIVPGDAGREPEEDDRIGRIGFLSIGVSHTDQAFRKMEAMHRFEINSQVTLVHGAEGAADASMIRDPNSAYWAHVDTAVEHAELSKNQVQVVYLRTALVFPPAEFEQHVIDLRYALRDIVFIIRDRFPNVAIIYLSNMPYAGYALDRPGGPTVPEPQSMEVGFAVKALIAEQINGELAPDVPTLLWANNSWANGFKHNQHDHLHWVCDHYAERDRFHLSDLGQHQEGEMLHQFLMGDQAARGWYPAGQPATSTGGQATSGTRAADHAHGSPSVGDAS